MQISVIQRYVILLYIYEHEAAKEIVPAVNKVMDGIPRDICCVLAACLLFSAVYSTLLALSFSQLF